MNLKKFYIGRAIGFIIVPAIVLCAFAVWKLQPSANTSSSGATSTPSATTTSTPIVSDKTAVDPALLIRLQADLEGITPYFLDVRSYDGKPLTPQEAKIRDRIVDILVSKEPANRDYYSPLWPLAIGKRYVLAAQPSASGYYDILIDSQTGESSFLQNATSYIIHPLSFERPQPASNGRQTVLYIGYQDLYSYTLDRGSFVLVAGSKLLGSETYHNGRSDFVLSPEETHDDNSIHISVFDSWQVIQDPYAQPNAMQTTNKKIREVTLLF